MRDKATFDDAVGLCEEVLAVRSEVFSISSVPDIEGLIRGMSKRQLAFFCRVLALVVFEAEERNAHDLKITHTADLLTFRREQAMLPYVKTTDRNQAVLLGLQDLLPRMVKLVVYRLPIMPMMPESDLSQGHFQELVSLLGFEDEDDWADDGGALGVVGGGEVLHAGALDDPNDWRNKALSLLTHQVEVLFVMCTLLSGKRKTEAQQRLLELGIVPALVSMFEHLAWNKAQAAAPPFERIHGPGCECNPESAMRIQYLRLVHNLCDMEFDHYQLKHALISQDELDSVANFAVLDQLRNVSDV